MNGIKSNLGVPACALALICAVVFSGCNLAGMSHNSKGTQAYYSGQLNTAINEFSQALNANPSDADAHYNLAACYAAIAQQTGNQQWTDQAEQLYRQAIAYNDQHVAAHRGLASLLIKSGKERFAFDLLDQWRSRYPTSESPLIELAQLYQEYGDHRRATDLLADALKLNGNSTQALVAMGVAREKQGQYELALNNYTRALQLSPQLQDVAQNVAIIQQRFAYAPPNGQTAPTNDRYGAINPFQQR